MGDVSKGEGRTVLFVSHNLSAVKTLCNKGILLQNGTLNFSGNIDATLDRYLIDNSGNENSNGLVFPIDDTKEAQILSVELKDEDGKSCIEYFTDKDIYVSITIKITLIVIMLD